MNKITKIDLADKVLNFIDELDKESLLLQLHLADYKVNVEKDKTALKIEIKDI